MDTRIFSLVMAAVSMAIAAPAAAHDVPRPDYPPSAYSYQPWAPHYGYNTPEFVTSMRDRIQAVRRDIQSLAARNVLTHQEFRNLDRQAWDAEVYLYRAPAGGMYPAEADAIENMVWRLERNVMRDSRDWDYGYAYGFRRF